MCVAISRISRYTARAELIPLFAQDFFPCDDANRHLHAVKQVRAPRDTPPSTGETLFR